jgi:hypothetical protein
MSAARSSVPPVASGLGCTAQPPELDPEPLRLVESFLLSLLDADPLPLAPGDWVPLLLAELRF